MTSPPPPDPRRIEAAAEQLQNLEHQIAAALVGQSAVIRELLAAAAAAGHVLLEGLPGVGKTLMVRAMAKAVGGRYSRIQFTPDLMPGDVTGHAIFDLRSERFHIRRGPIFCNILLGDEINRAPAKTQSAMLEAMQERQVTIEGEALTLEPPFLVLATQNPIEHEGTYPLPRAQLDRFLIKAIVDYPDDAEEAAIVRRVTAGSVGDGLDLSSVDAIMGPDDLLDIQAAAASLTVDDSVLDYAVRLVRATRDWPGIERGAGPRAGIALIRAARGNALLSGNGYVTPDDIKGIAPAVLRHRIKPTADLEIEGEGPDDVLAVLLANVPAPRA